MLLQPDTKEQSYTEGDHMITFTNCNHLIILGLGGKNNLNEGYSNLVEGLYPQMGGVNHSFPFNYRVEASAIYHATQESKA